MASSRSYLISFLVLCSLACLLVALPAAARDLDEIVESGELMILTFPHQESVFSRTNLAQGLPMPRLGGYADFVGVDIDLMQSFAENLGVSLKVRPVSEPRYAALIPDLLAGRGDLIASSLTITDERRQLVDFTWPYFEVYPVIVTRTGFGLEAGDDLTRHVGVVTAGSSHEQRLIRMGIEPATLVRVDFSIETFSALLDRDADYTLADSTSARRFVDTEPGLEVAFRLEGQDEYGFAVPKDAPNLLAELNRFIEQLQGSGEMARLLAKHIEGKIVAPSSATGVLHASD